LYHRFRPELEGLEDIGYVDPFHFISLLSDYARPDDVLAVGSSGFAPQTFMQAFKVKEGQRVTNCSTIGAMGADIPMAIGACIASGKRTLCVTGDGGFMLNVNELEVVRRLKLPIQFFVYSNNGYGSIRAMQKARFNGNYVGCDPASGFTIPRLSDIADCYGLNYQYIQSLYYKVEFKGQIIELMIDPDYVQLPRVATSMVNGQFDQDDMQDMTPKIPADELKQIMEWDG
jgi:acetolactate synthase-1/2/3 large subunit